MPLDSRTDAELIADANGGDDRAFEALYLRHRDWVLRLAFRFVHQDADALDVLQETFTHLHQRPAGFCLTGRLTTYLYPVVKHLALGVVRKRRRITHDEEALAAVPAPADAPEWGDLHRVVASLPEAQREVLLMRTIDGLALEEIAEALAIPLGTVKSRLHHAVRALRDDPQVRRFFERG